MRTIKLVHAFCLFLFPTLIFSQTKVQKIEQLFASIVKDSLFNGNVIVSESNKIVYQNCVGFSDIEKQIKNNSQSQFPIASISKTFTATAVLQLKQKGKLKLDDRVQEYISNFPYAGVTIRHLLSNTSGLGQYYNLFDTIMNEQPEKIITNQDIIPAFIRFKTPLSFTPGERWEYNNLNFCLAAIIIEKVSGMSFFHYLQRYIFQPAGMDHSLLPRNKKIKSSNQVELYTYANLYTSTLENVKNIPASFKIDERSSFYGNGGIVSTTSDLLKYEKALFANKLLTKAEMDEAFSPIKLNDGKIATYRLDEKEVTYGLGWEIYTDETLGKIIFHDGSIAGLTSMLMHNITKNQTVILLDNTGSNLVFATSNAIFSLINNQPYEIPKSSLSRIYGNSLEKGNIAKANSLISDYLKNNNRYAVFERDFIRLGYQFFRHNKTENALQTFYSTTLLFPTSWNAFDSYGEVLMKVGKKDQAKKMYEKSIELNPTNENGKKMLKEL